MNRKEDFAEKGKRVKTFLEKGKLEGLLLTYQRNFSWFTAGGENRVNTAATEGAASVLVTADKSYLIADNIETPRLLEEEVTGLDLEIVQFPWNESEKKRKIIEKICPLNLASDDGTEGTKQVDISHLQYSLTEWELERYFALGKEAAIIMSRTCRGIEKGVSEHEIAASLSGNLLKEGIIPTVVLIAADERISKFRHPIPQEKKVEKYVMAVLCAKRKGLIIAATRLVHFGKISEELMEKHQAVVRIDSSFILNSKVGRPIGEIFDRATEAYQNCGFPGEWKHHHQGGPMGYQERYFVATSGESRKVEINEPFGWNPSIRGTKSEDTIIPTSEGIKVVTEDETWPAITLDFEGQTISRPDILVK